MTVTMENVQEKIKPILTHKESQYTIWQILGVWFAAGGPMWILGWLVYPPLSKGMDLIDASLLRIKLITVGLVWQFVLSMVILYHEEGNICLETICRRFWLNQPIDAKTGEVQKSLWWWLVPLTLGIVFLEFGAKAILVDLWVRIFPFFTEPKGYDGSNLFAPEIRSMWIGAWDLYALFFVMALFNTVLGEEFIFRGVLLPKMEEVFGKWDWLANSVLFGLYHLHQPWSILINIATALLFVYPAKRFHSNWFSIILHSGQSIYFLFLLLGLVLGLA